MADVKWTFFADAAAAERAIVALEAKYLKLENSIKQTSKSSKHASQSATEGMKEWVTKLATVTVAYQTATTAVNFLMSSNEKFIKQADDLGAKYDVAIRKIRILGGLSALEGETAKKSIGAASAAFGYSTSEGQAAAQSLISAGFSPEQAQGPALVALMKTMAASGQFGAPVESGPLAESMASYLASQGKELNAKNVEQIGVAISQLARVSTMDLPDLGAVAKEGAVFSGRLSQEEQLAGITALRKVGGMPGAQATTAMRNMTLALTSQGQDKKKVSALAAFGLTPADVDLKGESFADVLGKFKTGIGKMAPEEVDPMLKKFFEKENLGGALALINNASLVDEYTKAQTDVAGFNNAVSIATSGPAAAGRRLDALNEQHIEEGTEFDSNVIKALRRSGQKRDIPVVQQDLEQTVYETMRYIGFGQNISLGAATLSPGAVKDELRAASESALRQEKLLERIASGVEKQKPINRNAQGEPAK